MMPVRKNFQKNYNCSEDFPKLLTQDNVMAKVLTQEVYSSLRDVITPTGFTFDEVIQPGVDGLSESEESSWQDHKSTMSKSGCVAGDEESYKVFSEFFNLVIGECHDSYPPEAKHKSNLDWTKLQDVCLDTQYVKVIRIHFHRNIRGICLPSHCTRHERRTVEKIVTEALATLKNELKGKYYPIDMPYENDIQELPNDGILFDPLKIPSLVSAKITRDWPDARGFWKTEDQSLAALINFEDHLCIMSSNFQGNFKSCFEKLCTAVTQLKASIKGKNHNFMKNTHLGHITSCPVNLGGFRVAVCMKLPQLSQNEDLLDEMLNMRGIQKSKFLLSHNENESESNCDEYYLTHKFCLGHSEIEWIQHMTKAIESLIQTETELNQ